MDEFVSSYYKKAEELKKEKKFEEALKLADKARKITQDQNSPQHWYSKGISHSERGEYEKALECFDNDLKLNKKNYDSLFEKGKILLELKKYPESLEQFNKAAETRNQNYLKNIQKVDHLKKARKFEKALIYTDKSVNEKPLDEIFWYYKGLVLLKEKKIESAISCFKESLKIKTYPNSIYELAISHILLGDEERGLTLLKKYQENNSDLKEKIKADAELSPISEEKKFRLVLELLK